MVSLSLPQEVPARAFKALFLELTELHTFAECFANVWRLSNVTPKILGFLTVGICSLSIKTSKVSLTSFVQVVNKVAEDF